MDVEHLIKDFISSRQGREAMQTLMDKGIGKTQASALLGHVAEAAARHVDEQHAPIEEHEKEGIVGTVLGEHAGRNFLTGIAVGLARGDGLVGSLEDGALAVVTGRISEVLVAKVGLDGGIAGTIAAAATPFIVGYLKEKLGVST